MRFENSFHTKSLGWVLWADHPQLGRVKIDIDPAGLEDGLGLEKQTHSCEPTDN